MSNSHAEISTGPQTPLLPKKKETQEEEEEKRFFLARSP
jgi:hypothetical protein